MGFKNFCCNCCAWFSVIGVVTFGIIAAMLYRRNPAVIEHKFHLKVDDDDKIDDRMGVMIIMQFVMMAAALCCFFLAFRYERIENEEDAKYQDELAKKVGRTFVDDALEE